MTDAPTGPTKDTPEPADSARPAPRSDETPPPGQAPRTGRPPKLDSYKRAEIAALVAVGCCRADAARYVGCSARTIRDTARRDPEFAEQLRRAERQKVVIHLKNIMEAGQKSWRASAWALERFYPRQYAPRKPESVTRDQMQELLGGFAEAIVGCIADHKLRRHVMRRLGRFVDNVLREGRDAETPPGK